MDRILSVLPLALAAGLCLGVNASASDSVAATGKQPTASLTEIVWWTCTATAVAPAGNPIQGPFQCYLSAPFSTDNVVLDKEGPFKAFVAGKYGVNVVNQICAASADEASAASALKIRLDDCNARRWKVTETGWKVAPGN